MSYNICKMSFLEKPHAVCIPTPAQGHINAMLKLAKLLHYKGFHITFVNTEFNHKRFLKSSSCKPLDELYDFRFLTIPDGLPPSDLDTNQDPLLLARSIRYNLLDPFRQLVEKLNKIVTIPSVTCIVADGFMPFADTVAKELEVLSVKFFPIAACSTMGFMHYPNLVEKGISPLKGDN